MGVLKFQPQYYTRPWGGRRLESTLARMLPDGLIGESWEIVDRPEAQSIVCEGPHKGQTLRAVITTASEWLMGPHWPKDRPFPLLIKWLDCTQRLSLQVHPPAIIAQLLKGEPKTEYWYVAEATADGGLFIGLRNGVSQHIFEAALKHQALERLLHRVPTHAGDACFIPSGRLHAIDAGNLILEIQQNSDTTYRAYDWGRVGFDGKPRALHIAETLACTHFQDYEPTLLPSPKGSNGEWVNCPEFRVMQYHLQKGGPGPAFPACESARVLSVVQGLLKIEDTTIVLKKGDNVLIPYAEAFKSVARAETRILITDQFA